MNSAKSRLLACTAIAVALGATMGVAVAATAPHMPPPPVVHEQGTAADPTLGLHTKFTDRIEWVNTKAGEYVA